MLQTASGQIQAATYDADTERTKRAFVGFLSSALGVDQTYANEDQYVSNAPGQYIIANPDGTYSQVGRSTSSQNQGSALGGLVLTPTLLILVAVAAYVILKK